MNAFEKIKNDLKEETTATINELCIKHFSTFYNFRGYIGELSAVVAQYKIDGKTPDIEALQRKYGFDQVFNLGTGPGPAATTTKVKKESRKENVEPLEDPPQSPPTVRPKRTTTKKATRNTANIDPRQNVIIKLEKMSIGSSENESGVTSAPFEPVTIKTEVDLMPAPKKPAVRKKKGKRSNSVVVKQEAKEEMKRKDSEVVLQEPRISVVTLSDSDDETVGRITRTKTRNAKRNRTDTESVENKEKRPRSDPKKNATITKDTTSNSEYADAVSTVEEGNPNATYIAKPSTKNNTTVTIGAAAQPEMTDDESDEDVPLSVRPKQIFSPFDHSPVKKKVEAFEKLNCATSEIPRLTRTKKRELLKKAESAENAEPKTVKEKTKMFTPGTSQSFRPKVFSTVSKTQKTSNDTTASSLSLSALKASQAEFRERELKRAQKEKEALMKREALLQAQMEEKKRKREEKQLKAQQMREAMEKEKQRVQDEEQRQKEERHKLVLAEQERKKLKIREETEKKRLLAKAKAIEERKKEEERKREEDGILDEQRKLREWRKAKTQMRGFVPVYMKSETPLLPTDDCYDSDDENYGKVPKGAVPSLAKGESIQRTHTNQIYVGGSVKDTFFSSQATTPDLEAIFQVIEKSKLRRKSSACWKNPPRFTMIPGLEKHLELEDDMSD